MAFLQNKILVACIVILCILFGALSIKQYFDNKRLEEQTIEWKNEALKYGEYKKLSENLSSYLAKIGNVDSIVSANKDIWEQLKKEKSIPKTIITYNTYTHIDSVEATTNEDPNDSTFRIAESIHPEGYYELTASYQIKKPYKFTFTKVSLKDAITLVEVSLENGRKKIYFKNTNPFVHIENPEVILNPEYVTLDKPIELKTWKWQVGAVTNWNTFNTEIFGGIYAPFGLGIQTSFTLHNKFYDPGIKNDLKIGLGYIKSF